MDHLIPYLWADLGREGGAEALCVTVFTHRTEAEMMAALGIDPTSRRDLTFAQAEELWTEDQTAVQLWSESPHVILVEPNGYLASLREVLPVLAGEGDAVAIFWNSNAASTVSVVRRGTLVRVFDALMYDDGEPPLPEESGLPFGSTDQPFASSLALLDRLTGFQATRERLLVPARPTYDVAVRNLLP